MTRRGFLKQYRALVASNRRFIRSERALGRDVSFPWNEGIRYLQESPGSNKFQGIQESRRKGTADCEDLTAWSVALELENGKSPTTLVEIYGSRAGSHVLYRIGGKQVDPSALCAQEGKA